MYSSTTKLVMVGLLALAVAGCASQRPARVSTGPVALPALYHGRLKETFAFVARVVRRDVDGTKVPMANVTLWRGTSKRNVRHGDVEPVEVTVDSAGRFSVPVIIRTAQFEGNKSFYIEPVVFLLRASNCADLVVPFDTDWHERDLTMTCD